MAYRTKDVIDAIDSDHELAEEASKRLYQLRGLVNAMMDLTTAIQDSKELTIEPQVLFALSDVFNVLGEIDIDV